jgi:putative transposase
VELLALRSLLYEEAKARNPKRWTGRTRDWERVGEVALNPAYEAA